jgi:hypothetical protein
LVTDLVTLSLEAGKKSCESVKPSGNEFGAVVVQVPGDGVGAGVEPLAGELGARRDDEVDGGLG